MQSILKAIINIETNIFISYKKLKRIFLISALLLYLKSIVYVPVEFSFPFSALTCFFTNAMALFIVFLSLSPSVL